MTSDKPAGRSVRFGDVSVCVCGGAIACGKNI